MLTLHCPFLFFSLPECLFQIYGYVGGVPDRTRQISHVAVFPHHTNIPTRQIRHIHFFQVTIAFDRMAAIVKQQSE